MAPDDSLFCDQCRIPIPDGDTYWCIATTQEVRRGGAVEVQDACVAWTFCRACAARLELEQLPAPRKKEQSGQAFQEPLSPEARDELARELGDFYCEALGEPHRVLHNDGHTSPHVDVYIYRPGEVLTGWTLVTVGRCTEPVNDQRVELVMHLRPNQPATDMAEAAEVLRRTALSLGKNQPGWTFKPCREERLVQLGKELVYSPTFLDAIYKRPTQ